ncbi:MAG: SDR family oxidoreductase [Candidatus Omnitrophica bacterium]|nr:SDR family oxidoreductase [Candidatus Omnitrophota bacterium]
MRKNEKKVFITGGTGLLGHYLIKTAPDNFSLGCSFFPASKRDAIPYNCDKRYMDIGEKKSLLSLLRAVKPDYLVHTAALADVDYVERNKDEARYVNLGGTLNIIEACKENRTHLIYISSNAVFDGENPPYAEDAGTNPINYYGELKVREENAVIKSGLKYTIIRPILMYGWNLVLERKNPVTWLIESLKKGVKVKMVDDIFCNPLFAEDCAGAIWRAVMLGKEGVFHVGGNDEVSRYEFACITAEVFGFDKKLIEPVKNSYFAQISPRPKNTTYCIDKIRRELNIFPRGVRDGLEAMKAAKDASA